MVIALAKPRHPAMRAPGGAWRSRSKAATLQGTVRSNERVPTVLFKLSEADAAKASGVACPARSVPNQLGLFI